MPKNNKGKRRNLKKKNNSKPRILYADDPLVWKISKIIDSKTDENGDKLFLIDWRSCVITKNQYLKWKEKNAINKVLEKIIEGKKKKRIMYKVSWKPTWELKKNCTPDVLKEWKERDRSLDEMVISQNTQHPSIQKEVEAVDDSDGSPIHSEDLRNVAAMFADSAQRGRLVDIPDPPPSNSPTPYSPPQDHLFFSPPNLSPTLSPNVSLNLSPNLSPNVSIRVSSPPLPQQINIIEEEMFCDPKIASESFEKNSSGIFTPPKNWPADVEYIIFNVISFEPEQLSSAWGVDLTSQQQQKILQRISPPKQPFPSFSSDLLHFSLNLLKQTVNPILGAEIRVVEDVRHPCYQSRGLFATRNWEAGEYIGPYAGEIRLDTIQRARYLANFGFIWKGETKTFVLDGEKKGNEARFINDFRGIGKEDNVVLETVNENKTSWLAVRVERPVRRGEEFLLDYGDAYWRALSS
eukprot:TRINITY_DN11970_c0_g1_i1.p1 TRINITY_DN11970_c0_g1~~TRINITY_DN11970_c0_g1_i1.p1  ORF type:complete len:464 (+),score=120.54 TRINITY_DN11970_c0_g1_i1:190-1581(+)